MTREIDERPLLSYPQPADNPACQCKENPMRAMFCMLGHLTECHAPGDCLSARCTHLLKYDGSEEYRGLDIVDAGYWAENSVRWFKDSPEPGKHCPCSYCGEAIWASPAPGPLRFVFRLVLDLGGGDDAQPAGYLQFKAGEDLPELIPELKDVAPADYLEARFHEECALKALPAVYAMKSVPVAHEDKPKPS
jgi:hypothetical protein